MATFRGGIVGWLSRFGSGPCSARVTFRIMNGLSQNQKNTHANRIVAGIVITKTFWICQRFGSVQRQDCMIVNSCVR